MDSFFHDFAKTENYPQETIDYIENQFKTSKFIFWDPDISKIDSFLISNGIDQSILHHLHLVEQFEYNYQNETINEYFIRLDNYLASFPTDISQNLFFIQCVDIGKSSLCYWDRNLQSWVEEIDLAISSRGKERPDGWLGYTLHGMFESDFWSGVTVGLSTITPHGAVAGACYGSAARGIKELFD